MVNTFPSGATKAPATGAVDGRATESRLTPPLPRAPTAAVTAEFGVEGLVAPEIEICALVQARANRNAEQNVNAFKIIPTNEESDELGVSVLKMTPSPLGLTGITELSAAARPTADDGIAQVEARESPGLEG